MSKTLVGAWLRYSSPQTSERAEGNPRSLISKRGHFGAERAAVWEQRHRKGGGAFTHYYDPSAPT